MRRIALTVSSLALAFALAPRRAAAQVPRVDVRVLAAFGGFGQLHTTSSEIGGTLGAIVLARSGLLQIGATAQESGAILAYTASSAGGLAGFALPVARGLRADLLGEVGGVRYDGVGKDAIFGNDPGVGGWLPYAGARAGFAYAFSPRATVHPEIGFSVAFEDDLGRKQVSDSYRDVAWFSHEATVVTTEHTLGGARLSARFTVGARFDAL